MKVEALLKQLKLCLKKKYINKDDEVILIGSGKCSLLQLGFIMPKIKEIDYKNYTVDVYGLGILDMSRKIL